MTLNEIEDRLANGLHDALCEQGRGGLSAAPAHNLYGEPTSWGL